jgi:hypothetical protein
VLAQPVSSDPAAEVISDLGLGAFTSHSNRSL